MTDYATPSIIRPRYCVDSYLIMLQVLLYVFKVVIEGSFLVVEGGVLLSGFLTKGDLTAIGIEEDTARYSPVPIIIKLQYDGIHFAWSKIRFKIWAEEISHGTVGCSEVNGS